MSSSTDDKARPRELSEGLLRQRRNLIAISVLLPLFFLSGAEIEKVNLLGTVIDIKRPLFVEWALCVLFFYFLIRYHQYFNEEAHVNQMYRAFRSTRYRRLEEYFYNWAIKDKGVQGFRRYDFEVLYYDKAKNERLVYEDYDLEYTDGDAKETWLTSKCRYILFWSNGTGEDEEKFNSLMSSMSLETCRFSQRTGTYDEQSFTGYEAEFEYCSAMPCVLSAVEAVSFAWRQSYVTDYVFPFFLAATSSLLSVYAAIAM